jgi:hypothetical protein
MSGCHKELSTFKLVNYQLEGYVLKAYYGNQLITCMITMPTAIANQLTTYMITRPAAISGTLVQVLS